ncbi:hypothetical protein ACIA8R_05585 [Nonomuraea sp. NPDC051191]
MSSQLGQMGHGRNSGLTAQAGAVAQPADMHPAMNARCSSLAR